MRMHLQFLLFVCFCLSFFGLFRFVFFLLFGNAAAFCVGWPLHCGALDLNLKKHMNTNKEKKQKLGKSIKNDHSHSTFLIS